MTRENAAKLLREELDKYGLQDWSVRIIPQSLDGRHQFLGLCSYKDKCIILNAHHIDIHPDPDVVDTIRHEVAHALTHGHGHDEIWAAKAKEIGCTSTMPCSNLDLPPGVIDAIRSGATVEVSFEEEVIRRPQYRVTRLQDRCEICNKVAVTVNEILLPSKDDEKPDTKMIWLECGHILTKLIPKGTPFHKMLADADPNCQHVFPAEGKTRTVCDLCGAKRPYEFQLDGMRFGEQAIAVNSGVIIMDEMGLGKTVQAAGIIKYHPELYPILFIVKSGIKFQWFKENLRWIGDNFLCQVIQSSKDVLIPGLKGYIVGYDMLVPKVKKGKGGKLITQGFDITKFDKIGIKTVVLDECQQIKNPDSTRTQMVRKIAKGRKVIGLSGTPWKNRGSEFFSILNMIAPMKFSSYQAYKDRWVEYYWHGKYVKEGGIKRPEQFKEYIKDIAIRRERKEVMKELPLVNRTKLSVQLDDTRQEVYEETVSEFVKWYNNAMIGGEELSGMNILAKLSHMRHVVGLGKIPATQEFVDEFIENTDRKIVVFVHHIDVGEFLYNGFKEKYHDIKVFKLTGGMSPMERFDTQEEFNKTPKCILVASTLAAGEGLNLQTCSDCVMHERQWNPANEEQAEGRFIRIGQESDSVNATYAEAIDTVDSHLNEIIESKRLRFHRGMNTGEIPKWDQDELAKELAQNIVDRFNKKNKKSN